MRHCSRFSNYSRRFAERPNVVLPAVELAQKALSYSATASASSAVRTVRLLVEKLICQSKTTVMVATPVCLCGSSTPGPVASNHNENFGGEPSSGKGIFHRGLHRVPNRNGTGTIEKAHR